MKKSLVLAVVLLIVMVASIAALSFAIVNPYFNGSLWGWTASSGAMRVDGLLGCSSGSGFLAMTKPHGAIQVHDAISGNEEMTLWFSVPGRSDRVDIRAQFIGDKSGLLMEKRLTHYGSAGDCGRRVYSTGKFRSPFGTDRVEILVWKPHGGGWGAVDSVGLGKAPVPIPGG